MPQGFLGACRYSRQNTARSGPNQLPLCYRVGVTTRDSRRDWASYEPNEIPTKVEVLELDAFMDDVGEAGARVLDLGCGSGRISRALAGRGFDVVGVDINQNAIATGAGQENPELYVRDITSPNGLDLPGPPFRIVVCQLVLSVVGGTPEREALLKNAFDVLEPGGFFYLSASEVSDDVNPAYRRLYRDDFPDTGERYTYFSRDACGNILYTTHHFTGPELSALVEGAGFELTRLSSTTETSSRRPDEAAHFLYARSRRPI